MHEHIGQDPSRLPSSLFPANKGSVAGALARAKCQARSDEESVKEAEELVDSVERARADFIQKYFKIEWPYTGFITL